MLSLLLAVVISLYLLHEIKHLKPIRVVALHFFNLYSSIPFTERVAIILILSELIYLDIFSMNSPISLFRINLSI